MNIRQALHTYGISYREIQEMIREQLEGLKNQLKNMTDASIVQRLLTHDISIKHNLPTFYSLAQVYEVDTAQVQKRVTKLELLQDHITKQCKELFAPLNATECSLGPKFFWVHLSNEESLGFTLQDPAVPFIVAQPLEEEEKKGISLTKTNEALRKKVEAILNQELA